MNVVGQIRKTKVSKLFIIMVLLQALESLNIVLLFFFDGDADVGNQGFWNKVKFFREPQLDGNIGERLPFQMFVFDELLVKVFEHIKNTVDMNIIEFERTNNVN